MKREIVGKRSVIIEIDGQYSEPMTPLPPAVREQLEKIRQKYIKAGLISEQTLKPSDPEPPAQLDSN